MARPCPYVSCRYNLALNVNRSGVICRLRHKDGSVIEPWELDPARSCVLDLVEREQSYTMSEIAELLCVSRQRMEAFYNQILSKLLRKA